MRDRRGTGSEGEKKKNRTDKGAFPCTCWHHSCSEAPLVRMAHLYRLAECQTVAIQQETGFSTPLRSPKPPKFHRYQSSAEERDLSL